MAALEKKELQLENSKPTFYWKYLAAIIEIGIPCNGIIMLLMIIMIMLSKIVKSSFALSNEKKKN